MSNADCIPVTATPGVSRLYADFCAGAASGFLPVDENWSTHRPPAPAHSAELVSLLATQNTSASTAPALEALRNGAGTVLTGQQVTLFGGPLFTPFKAATALARARTATAAGHPHAAIFWLATEDHDFAEINHVVFPARRSLEKLIYSSTPSTPVPVGNVVIDDSISPLLDRASELIGFSDAMEALAAAYKPGRTFAQAFTEFYAKIFAAQGLLIVDASGREFHRLGARVLRAGIELTDELHAALLERNKALEASGYHAQVAVGPQSSLLFLIDDQTGARQALKRIAPNANDPNGQWQKTSGQRRQGQNVLHNNWMSEPFDYPVKPLDRGKVLTAEDLERLGGFARYRNVDGDAIGWAHCPERATPRRLTSRARDTTRAATPRIPSSIRR